MPTYVAFLRGINVGGNKKVPMQELRSVFSSLGFTDVKTFLASGNVRFEGKSADAEKLSKALEKHFGFTIPVALRTIDELRAMGEPFKGVKVTPKTRRYVMFLSQDSAGKKLASAPNFEVYKIARREVFTVLTVEDSKTVDLMQAIEKTFGKDVTTRKWNTIEKILV